MFCMAPSSYPLVKINTGAAFFAEEGMTSVGLFRGTGMGCLFELKLWVNRGVGGGNYVG